MGRFLIALSLLPLLSCAPWPDEDAFFVVDQYGSIVHKTIDETEAQHLSDKLNVLGRSMPSRPFYFVIRPEKKDR